MDLIQYITKVENMNIQDFIENRKKIAGKEKAMEELKIALEKFDKDDFTFLSPVGTEIHSAPSVISTKTRPATLRDKLIELEQLSQRVMERKVLEETLADMQGDDDPEFTDDDEIDPEEDLSFGSEKHTIVDEPAEDPIEPGDGDGEEPAAPQSLAGEQPKPEPGEDGDGE